MAHLLNDLLCAVYIVPLASINHLEGLYSLVLALISKLENQIPSNNIGRTGGSILF